MILIEDCTILDDENNSQGYNTGQHIVINGNTIEAITEKRPEQNFERVISGQGLLAMPGLVNAHTHSPENYMRGTTEKLPLEPWLATLVMMSGSYTPRDHYLNVMLGAIEMVRSGVTSVVDHLWSPILTPEILDTAMQSYRESGLRAAVAPLCRDVHRDAELGIERGHPLNDTF
jgi:cytosine/adenosine deaminase-related metal-dependent hydrolase